MTDVKRLVSCHKCGGTGKVDAETNELDLLIEGLSTAGYSDVDSIIDTALSRAHIKKSKREHAARLIRFAFAGLKDRCN